MGIKIYTAQGCVSCIKVELLLKEKGVKFEKIDINKHPEAMERLSKLGITSLPFIEIDDESIEGFNPNEIIKAIEKLNLDD